MVNEPEDRVADIVSAASGRLVSRVRLQKMAYLLDKLGAESGFAFAYHHYGPYSRDLDTAILDAEAFDKIREKIERRQSDGAHYSVFEAFPGNGRHEYTYLANERLRESARRLSTVNVTVLELAATANWLLKEERVADWKTEIVRRKGPKTRNGRLEEAVQLLSRLGLEPARI
jgi:uncharacterized protein YwgA